MFDNDKVLQIYSYFYKGSILTFAPNSSIIIVCTDAYLQSVVYIVSLVITHKHTLRYITRYGSANNDLVTMHNQYGSVSRSVNYLP